MAIDESAAAGTESLTNLGSQLQLLPNLEHASVSREKLYEYVLNPEHPEGRHKARVFASVLGIERRHADVLAQIIIASLPRAAAGRRQDDEYGQSWTTYHEIVGLNAKTAIITVAWKILVEEPERPKLVSCYIDLDEQQELTQLLRMG